MVARLGQLIVRCSHLVLRGLCGVWKGSQKRIYWRVRHHTVYLLYRVMLQVQAVFHREPVNAGFLFWEMVGLRPHFCGFEVHGSAASLLVFFGAIFSGSALFFWDAACHRVPEHCIGVFEVPQCVLPLSSFEPAAYSNWAYTVTVSHSAPSGRVRHLGDLAPTHPTPAGSYIWVLGAWLSRVFATRHAWYRKLWMGWETKPAILEKVARFV